MFPNHIKYIAPFFTSSRFTPSKLTNSRGFFNLTSLSSLFLLGILTTSLDKRNVVIAPGSNLPILENMDS